MISLVAAALTDVGLLREVNEDVAWAQVYYTSSKEPVGLFIVCDGMGGHLGGEFASYWAAEAIKRELSDLFIPKDPRATIVLSEDDMLAARSGVAVTRRTPVAAIESRMNAAIQKANHVVYEYAIRKPEKAGNAGTTITMAVVHGDKLIVANAGDSRAYLLRDHMLEQITKDHSVVAGMVATGQILSDEIYTHPQRNVIFRFLGQQGMVQADIFQQTLLPGDYLLLCSDGLWEMVRGNRKMAEIIESCGDPALACQELAAAANHSGGEDNIGIVVVKVT